MADIIVHLTISGMIALHPIDDPAVNYKWRVVVPDLSAHSHVASMTYEDAACQYNVLPLSQPRTAKIDGVTAEGTRDYPEELLTLDDDACNYPANDCAKVRAVADLPKPPLLELMIADAGLTATWVDTGVAWYLEREKNGKKYKKHKAGKGSLIAEEVCLTFKTTANPFVLTFTNGETVSFAPNGKGFVELRLQNVEPGTVKFEAEDKHFQMYYQLVKAHDADDVASLKTDAKERGPIVRRHDHLLSGAVLNPARVKVVQSLKGGPAFQASSLFPKGFEPMSLTGSNCPPIGGGGWP